MMQQQLLRSSVLLVSGRMVMLTSDSENVYLKCCQKLGLDDYGWVLPEDKVQYPKKFQQEGYTVCNGRRY